MSQMNAKRDAWRWRQKNETSNSDGNVSPANHICVRNRETTEISNNRRVQVIETGATYVIYVDTLTGVQYLRVYSGGVCVMVDADGKPLA